MSVGHVARLVEEAGIPTVIVASQIFTRPLEAMHLPRVLLTPNLLGRPLGRPFDRAAQMVAVQKGLSLLESAEVSGTVKMIDGIGVGPR